MDVPSGRTIMARMRNRLLLTGAAAWTAWVLAHYYAPVAAPPEIADGLLSSSFPYWQDAWRRALWSLCGAALTLVAGWGFGTLFLRALHGWRTDSVSGAPLFDNAVERLTYELTCGCVVLSSASL